jgi:hypothetical protein
MRVREMDFLLMRSEPNLMLLFLSRAFPPPAGFTAIPPYSDCRIFRRALWQRNCGACAAFAVSTLVAMHACLRSGEDFIPSPYRIFDCANGTCGSGLTFDAAISAVQFDVGDVHDSVARFGLPCDYPRRKEDLVPHGFAPITLHDPAEIKTALMLFGPLLGSMTHAIRRDPYTRAYRLLPNLTQVELLHAVVVVGWDAADNWIVQNSWGERWGDGLGRGRIAQDVLGSVFDPSVRLLTRGCLVAYYAVTVASVLLATRPSHRLAFAVVGGTTFVCMLRSAWRVL